MRILLVDYAGHPFQYDLSCELGTRGHEVIHTYSSSTLTPQTGFEPSINVVVEPVSIGRPFEKYRIFRRLRDEVSYGVRTVLLARRCRPDRILASNVPLVSLLILWLYALAYRRPKVLWLQDLQSGLAGMIDGQAGLVPNLLRRLEYFLIRRADHVVAISDGFAQELASSGIGDSQVTVIENWAPLSALPERPRANPWSAAHGLDGKTVLLYSGTLGMKHSPGMLKALAEEFELDENVEVVVIAEGTGADWLRGQPEPRPRMLPFQPFEAMPDVLGSGDVLIVLLEESAGAFSVPSKTLSYLCAGRPVLGAVPAENLAAEIIDRRAHAGVVVAPGASTEMCRAARRLVASPSEREAKGRAARNYAEVAFERNAIADSFEKVLDLVPASTPKNVGVHSHV
jgi:colanic acid biosynthesis glycosyl transferase WcaI